MAAVHHHGRDPAHLEPGAGLSLLLCCAVLCCAVLCCAVAATAGGLRGMGLFSRLIDGPCPLAYGTDAP